MIRARAAATIVITAIATGACGSSGEAPLDAAPRAAVGPLPEGIVARVGSSAIHGESVGRIAALQHLDLPAARDVAVRDALFAGVLARRLLRSIRDEAERAPLTADELTEAAERREQRGGVPRALIAPELLEGDIWNARAHAVVAQLLSQNQARTERTADADALLALVHVER